MAIPCLWYIPVEQYYKPVELARVNKYDLIVETENRSTGAARMRLFWKTPAIFAREQGKVVRKTETPTAGRLQLV